MDAFEVMNLKMKDQLKEFYDISVGVCEHNCRNCATNRLSLNKLKVDFDNLESHRTIKSKLRQYEDRIEELSTTVKVKSDWVDQKHQRILDLEKELDQIKLVYEEKLKLTVDSKLLQDGKYDLAITLNENLKLQMEDLRIERNIDHEKNSKPAQVVQQVTNTVLNKYIICDSMYTQVEELRALNDEKKHQVEEVRALNDDKKHQVEEMRALNDDKKNQSEELRTISDNMRAQVEELRALNNIGICSSVDTLCVKKIDLGPT